MAHEGNDGCDNGKDEEKGDGVVRDAAFDHVADEVLHEVPWSEFAALGREDVVNVPAFFEGVDEVFLVWAGDKGVNSAFFGNGYLFWFDEVELTLKAGYFAFGVSFDN